jgi:hypothetical protein
MSKFALRSLASIIVLSFLFSCENEYSEVGTGFINSIEVQPAYESENVIAYSEKHNSIRTNGFRNLLLGKYADPVYGLSEAKILTQVSLSQTRPDFGEDPIVDSVVMTLPFFSRQVQQNEYVLDSVYGEGSFKINVFQSNQFLRNLDPGQDGDFQDNQLYFTDQLDEFRPNISSDTVVSSQIITPSELTEDVILAQRNEEGTIDTLSLSPRIRIKMPIQHFEERVVNASPEVLASNTAFRNFLRGYLIEAEQQQPVLSMSMFDLQNPDANITIYYRNGTEETNDDGESEVITTYSEFALNFEGIKLNLYENDFNVDLTNQNTEEGEENIYLKGGQGSSGIIELFTGPDLDGNGVSDELDELRANNWLINEARLDLYLNEQIAPTSKNKINRVFLFNLDEEVVLEDFVLDPTASENPALSRQVHLGPLREDENGDPFYRIRVTSFINNIINNDSTNVRLGLYVSTNINEPSLVETKEPELGISENVPRSMMETPRGIVIHGNRSATETKRLKLRIFYTETN